MDGWMDGWVYVCVCMCVLRLCVGYLSMRTSMSMNIYICTSGSMRMHSACICATLSTWFDLLGLSAGGEAAMHSNHAHKTSACSLDGERRSIAIEPLIEPLMYMFA